ncbi:MAG: N-acetyltransferase Eis [Acidimicrobiales bacterium]|nr:MAG: GNAT family N-acetyltransferase [Actinomycetota bacterium]MBV6509303.1 N-acetyltransferase Eis [Acidimicrobiales bacterium]RIK03972.1 MAG: hypothetical protein DCC48_14800 [Acidobacteriota bacterium]
MSIDVRLITEDEFPYYSRTVWRGFGSASMTEEDIAAERSVAELDRCFAAVEGGEIVGTSYAHSFAMTCPGGAELPTGGIAGVIVLATHRRRGLASALMAAVLEQAADRGELAVALTASESSIYRRFGFGVATLVNSYEIDSRHARVEPEPGASGRLRILSVEDAYEPLQGYFDEYRRTRAGEMSRTPSWWRLVLGPRPYWRGGGSLHVAVHETASGSVDGYALYRQRGADPTDVSSQHIDVVELHSHDPEVELALWQFCFGVDLVRTVSMQWGDPDPVLAERLDDPRQLRVTSRRDFLWVRLLDVAGALSARGYSGDGTLVLSVKDDFRAGDGGCFTLSVHGGQGRCEPSPTARADLELELADLSAVYLGREGWRRLLRAGRVAEQRAGAAAEADRLFNVVPAPYCATPF